MVLLRISWKGYVNRFLSAKWRTEMTWLNGVLGRWKGGAERPLSIYPIF